MKQLNRHVLFTLCGVPILLVGLLLMGLVWSTNTLMPHTALAQTEAAPGITSPVSGSAVNGSTPITGTATHPAFQRYELYYKLSAADEEAYIYFGGGEQEIINGLLGRWDTDGLQPNSYDLRLRVVRTDGNYSEYIVPDLQVGAEPVAPSVSDTVTDTVTDIVTTTVAVTDTAQTTETADTTVTTAPTATADISTVDIPTESTPTLPSDVAQIVTDRNLNVRGGPSTDFPIIATLTSGDRARVTGQNEAGDWWQIALEEIGATGEGWVLGRLVTATNVTAVPIVAVTVPAITPTSTVTPVITLAATPLPPAVETDEVTEESTDESTDEVVTAQEESAQAESTQENSAPAAISTTSAATVTLTGDAGNPERLAALLRMVLLSFSSSETTVTATVGSIPLGLPISVTLPATTTIVGGVERAGEFEAQQLFLTTAGTSRALVNELRSQLLSQGYTAPAQTAPGGATEVFLSSNAETNATLLCNQAENVTVNLGAATITGAGETVTLLITPISRFGDPCSGNPVDTDPTFDVLPQLAPPPRATVRGSGGGSSSGPDSVSVSAEAAIETGLTAGELADHYERQLISTGWRQLDQSWVDALTWSTWSIVDDDGMTWSITFYVVQQGPTGGSYTATLRAESQP